MTEMSSLILGIVAVKLHISLYFLHQPDSTRKSDLKYHNKHGH